MIQSESEREREIYIGWEVPEFMFGAARVSTIIFLLSWINNKMATFKHLDRIHWHVTHPISELRPSSDSDIIDEAFWDTELPISIDDQVQLLPGNHWLVEPLDGTTTRAYLQAVERGLGKRIDPDLLSTEQVDDILADINRFKESMRPQLITRFYDRKLTVGTLLGDHIFFGSAGMHNVEHEGPVCPPKHAHLICYRLWS